MKRHISKNFFVPFTICLLFFSAYTLLGVIKHLHFLSGFDLAIADQIVWKYAHFKNSITTVQYYVGTSLLTDHVEIIYFFLAPFYWVYDSAITIILLQVLSIIAGGMAMYLLARRKNLSLYTSSVLLISFFMFFGVQNALFSDVHSVVFGVGFLAWFIYFFDKEHWKLTMLFFILAIFSKEDFALYTLIISFLFFLAHKKTQAFIFIFLSLSYLYALFFVYFPHFTHDGYRYQNHKGLFADFNIFYFFNTSEKRQVIFYSLASFGFTPVFAPTYLLLFCADLAQYFILGNTTTISAQGLFQHYRVTLALFLVWPSLVVMKRWRQWQTVLATYLLLSTLLFQYLLHSPLSYLSKPWFWHIPASVIDINRVLLQLPPGASVVAQNNIAPHITHRDNIFILWPEKKDFIAHSPCGYKTCDWFRWADKPTYVVIDTGADWDIRHFLTNRDNFLAGIKNLEKARVITPIFTSHTAVLYKIVHQP